jgi:8-amino-7-oxononanoate synthase
MIWGRGHDLDSWHLAQLKADGLLRRRRTLDAPCGPEALVDGRRLIAFCSNDYLGLANHPALVTAARAAAERWGVGSGASHVVSGHLRPHQELEERLAAFVGRERALYFGTGYMANLAIVPALVGRDDAVFADKLNHASLIDAALLARAEHLRYPHGDMDTLAQRLERSSARRKLILTDAVFSMDGDLAPLPELFALAERFDAWLVVDDAHGFGVMGPGGQRQPCPFWLTAVATADLDGNLGQGGRGLRRVCRGRPAGD